MEDAAIKEKDEDILIVAHILPGCPLMCVCARGHLSFQRCSLYTGSKGRHFKSYFSFTYPQLAPWKDTRVHWTMIPVSLSLVCSMWCDCASEGCIQKGLWFQNNVFVDPHLSTACVLMCLFCIIRMHPCAQAYVCVCERGREKDCGVS